METMVDSRLEVYVEDAFEILDMLNIEYRPIVSILVNNRLKALWGRCKMDKNEGIFYIEISGMLIGDYVSYEAIMSTLLHEMLHCHEDRFCHTGEWKHCAELINRKFGFNIKRTTTAAEKNLTEVVDTSYKYLIACDTCGATNKYKRKSKIVKILMKHPDGACKCGLCGGTSFTVTEESRYD